MKKPILLFLALFATLLSPASPRLLTPVSAPSAPTLSSMKHATPIDRVHFDGGYIDDDGKVYYHIGDYQGNVVAVMRGNGIVVQTAHYYPYGEPWLEPDGTNRHLYGGKERIAALGGAYDYGARLLNSRVGTWYQQDPCAEDYRWLSPYSVCAADPVNITDPSGMILSTMIDGAVFDYINGSKGWGFYNGEEMYKSGNEYVDLLLEALATLQERAVGSALVESLVDADDRITIEKSKENAWRSWDKTIQWNPEERSSHIVDYGFYLYSASSSKPYISLSHEMFHAESHLAGYKFKRLGGSGPTLFGTDEWWAVYGENYIRAEHGVEARIGYGLRPGPQDRYPYGVIQVMYPNSDWNRFTFNTPSIILSILNFRKGCRK